MIPLYDNVQARSFPVVTWALILINVLVFLFEATLNQEGLRELFIQFSVVPLAEQQAYAHHHLAAAALPLFTSMFLHGGWMHVIGNMLYLYIFGNNVEDRLGHFRFILFYIVCGLGAGLAHVVTNLGSSLPTVGASGAIAGVLGAYLVFYPGASIATLMLFGIFTRVVAIPASLYLVVWFLMQAMNGMASLASPHSVGGVAWWAHIGGFVLGMALGWLMASRESPDQWRNRPEWV